MANSALWHDANQKCDLNASRTVCATSQRGASSMLGGDAWPQSHLRAATVGARCAAVAQLTALTRAASDHTGEAIAPYRAAIVFGSPVRMQQCRCITLMRWVFIMLSAVRHNQHEHGGALCPRHYDSLCLSHFKLPILMQITWRERSRDSVACW